MEADVAAALEARGFDAEILSDGSLAIGGKDILVLYGSLGRLRGTARLRCGRGISDQSLRSID